MKYMTPYELGIWSTNLQGKFFEDIKIFLDLFSVVGGHNPHYNFLTVKSKHLKNHNIHYCGVFKNHCISFKFILREKTRNRYPIGLD